MVVYPHVRHIVIDIDAPSVQDPFVVYGYTNIQRIDTLPADEQFTDDQLLWYDDFIGNILSAVRTKKFPISDHYQSNDSYSYYVQFQAYTQQGRPLGAFDIKLRMTDHHKTNPKTNTELAEEQASSGKNVIFRSVRINEVSKQGLADTLQTVWTILDSLQEGNLSVLDGLGR